MPGPLKPLMAIPTTAGTGSETTGVAIFDLERLHAKTGIAHRRLKPTLGYLDPENTRTMPSAVAASTGLDILSHAVESYTAMPFTDRPRPERPILRPAYQGSNPISDVWSLQALRMVAQFLVRAVEDSDDETLARTCCWPRHTRASGSAMPACTSRTACRIPCPDMSGITARPATRSIIRSCLTGYQSFSMRRRSSVSPRRQVPRGICRRPRRWASMCRAHGQRTPERSSRTGSRGS